MIGQLSLFAVLAVALVAEGVSALAPAVDGEFRYQVSVKINGHHACGGAIVGYQHILTSAKCVKGLANEDELVVVTSSLSSTNGGEIYKARKIVSHPDFDSENPGSNDIAVIALNRVVRYNKNQKNLYLPSHYAPSGVVATLTGWRWATYSQPPNAEVLKKIGVQIITTEECQRHEPSVGAGQVCASVESGRGSCVADAGGPLVYDNELVGILSDGNPCGGGTPGVFTSVFHHIHWIFETIRHS